MNTGNHKIMFEGKLYDTAEQAGLPAFPEVLEAVDGAYYGRSADEPPLPGAVDAFVCDDEDGNQHLLVRHADGEYRRDPRWDGSYHRRADLQRAPEPPTRRPPQPAGYSACRLARRPARNRTPHGTAHRTRTRRASTDAGDDGEPRPPCAPPQTAGTPAEGLRLVPPEAVVLTTAAAAAFLGYKSTAAIRMLIHRKKLRPFGRRERTSVFLLEDLKTYLKSGLNSCRVGGALRDGGASSSFSQEGGEG